MADIKPENDDVRSIPAGPTGGSSLRGSALDGTDQRSAADHVAYAKKRNTDKTLRLDGEADTLYEDGLELEDDSVPLTGKDGRDDSIPER